MPKKKRALFAAHRGDHRRFAENTLKAFEDAVRAKMDYIECDLHETADGSFVIFHDNRLHGCSIKDMKLDEIAAVRLESDLPVPTLEQTLDYCRGKIGVFLEIKGLRSFKKFAGIIREYKFSPGSLIIISFKKNIIARMAKELPEITRGLNMVAPVPDIKQALVETGAALAIIDEKHLTPEFAAQVREADASVAVWNIKDKDTLERCIELGAICLITDNPALAR